MSDPEPDRGNPHRPTGSAVAVIKIGGSVLTGPAAWVRAASFLTARLEARPAERLVVVVSAEKGLTDELLRTARDHSPEPDPRALDLLWSTGELRSVALLTLALCARGTRAAALNVHQTGVGVKNAGTLRVRVLRVRACLADHDVVVAPGFLARGDGDAILSLGRGGSDLSAVLLAAALDAPLELIKDVPGYFDADPARTASAQHLPTIDSATAVRMAEAGCELVQHHALRAARTFGVPIVVRSWDSAAATFLHHGSVGGAGRPVSRAAAPRITFQLTS